MARQPDGPPPPPVVQKLRLRYAKRGRLRFSSHRDFQRALERALRRADVPMAYSAGFHPHPKISFANAAPTGTASEAEYVELSLAARCDPEAVRAALDASLPPGLDVVQVVEATPGALADRLEASEWVVVLPGAVRADVETAVAAFLAAERVDVERLTKNGPRALDAREPVVSLVVEDDSDEPALRLVVRHVVPTVRPNEVLAGLAGLGLAVGDDTRTTRRCQGPLRDGAIADPLA
ncbi:TIGR03936 family radical SAM-associated protein [Angustibacter peucedani]